MKRHPCRCETSPNREAAMVTIRPGVWCDPCIADLVAALNAWNIATVASCCGHGEQFDPTMPGANGSIALADGRELVVRTPQPEGENPMTTKTAELTWQGKIDRIVAELPVDALPVAYQYADADANAAERKRVAERLAENILNALGDSNL